MLESSRAWGWVVAVGSALVGMAGGALTASAEPIAAPGATLAIYSSLPLRFPPFSDGPGIVRGARVALAEAKNQAGEFAIPYRSLDDSPFSSGNWDPGAAAKNARRARSDPL